MTNPITNLPILCPQRSCDTKEARQQCADGPRPNRNEDIVFSWTQKCTEECGENTVGCTSTGAAGSTDGGSSSPGSVKARAKVKQAPSVPPARCPSTVCDTKNYNGLCAANPGDNIGADESPGEVFETFTDMCTNLCGANSVGCTGASGNTR